MNFMDSLELDIHLRAVGERERVGTPAYVEASARFGWQLSESFELSVVGANLLHESHAEGGADAPFKEVRRFVYVGARWNM
jgi:hypothetical protein